MFICGQVFACTYVFISLGVELLGLIGILSLTFRGLAKLFSTVAPFYILTSRV